jgi:hypothetical protein
MALVSKLLQALASDSTSSNSVDGEIAMGPVSTTPTPTWMSALENPQLETASPLS